MKSVDVPSCLEGGVQRQTHFDVAKLLVKVRVLLSQQYFFRILKHCEVMKSVDVPSCLEGGVQRQTHFDVAKLLVKVRVLLSQQYF